MNDNKEKNKKKTHYIVLNKIFYFFQNKKKMFLNKNFRIKIIFQVSFCQFILFDKLQFHPI
jgi:hypothetical protein